MTADPLKDLEIDIQSYDVERTASVYYDNQGIFNGREKGENAIEITRQLAMKFFNDEMSMDEWLSRFYPKQMTVYRKAISQARSQLLGM